MKNILAVVLAGVFLNGSFAADLSADDFKVVKVQEARREIADLKNRLEKLDKLLATLEISGEAKAVPAEPVVITTSSYPQGATYSAPVYSTQSCPGGNCSSPSATRYQTQPSAKRYFFRR